MAYATIDIGYAAIDSANVGGAGNTEISNGNAANATGVLTSFEFWFNSNGSGVKCGTFSGSAGTYDDRDYESIGSVTAGSKQTFTGKNCDVTAGDLLGIYFSGGLLDKAGSGGDNYLIESTDTFGLGSHYYFYHYSEKSSFYATGVTVPDAPTSVSATDNLSDKVTITWTAGTGETGGHRVYRDGADISGVVAHGTSTYNDTGGTVGTTYAYTVKAINPAGLSAASTADNGIKIASSSFIQQIMKTNYTSPFGGII